MNDENDNQNEIRDDEFPTFAQLPRETREIIDMRGRKMVEDSIPKELRPAIYDTAKKLNVPIDVVVLAHLNCTCNAMVGKFSFITDDGIIPQEKQDFSSMTPFKEDFKRAKAFFDSIFDEIRRKSEEQGS